MYSNSFAESLQSSQDTHEIDPIESVSQTEPEEQERKKLSRREFIRLTLGALGALGTAATIDRFGNVIQEEGKKQASRLIGASEVGRSFIESGKNYESDEVEITETEILRQTDLFTITRLTVDTKGNGRKFHPIKIVFGPEYKSQIAEVPSAYKKDLLNSETSEIPEPMLVCPSTYVVGRYHQDAVSEGETPTLDTGLTTKTNTGVHFGPEDIENRFPGKPSELNEASGGIAIQENRLHLCGRTELERHINEGNPYMQMVFYIDESTAQEVLGETWTHFSFSTEIGNTSYYWGAYYEVPHGDGVETGVILVDEEMVPLTNLVRTVKQLSDTGEFKFVLSDGGNGSSVLGRDASEKFAYGVNGFETHLSPAAIVIE